MMQRHKPWRSEKYIAFVRRLSCANCGKAGQSEAHHLIGLAGIGGTGTKAADQFAIPLCRSCHDDLHQARIPLDDQWRWLVRTLERGFNDGILGDRP